MIIDLPKTTTVDISKKLVSLRSSVGAMALGRVLTLVVVVDEKRADDAIEIANEASRQHPSRIIVIVTGDKRGTNRLDAQIRLGGDAGASEVVVLRLYGPLAGHGPNVVVPLLLPDSPIVAWWPGEAPPDVATDPIGRMAQRRITDSAQAPKPRSALRTRAKTYRPGDTDLAWTRVTRWRGLLAAALDQAPYETITRAIVSGSPDSPSTDLLAAWLAVRLRCPVDRLTLPRGSGIGAVRLERKSGPIDLVRPEDAAATLTQAGQPDRLVALARRTDPECLADELRRLDPDDIYAAALTKGLEQLHGTKGTAAEAARKGMVPAKADVERLARHLEHEAGAQQRAAMVTAELPEPPSDEQSVRKATARKLADKPTPREEAIEPVVAKAQAGAGTAAVKKAARRARAAKTATKSASKTATKATTRATTKATQRRSS